MILSAVYASENQEGVVIITDERGAVLVTTPEDQAALKAWRDAGGIIEPFKGATLEGRRAAAVMDRFSFAEKAASAGFISWQDAANWAAGNSLPTQVQAVVDSLPEDRRGRVYFDLITMEPIRRMGALMPQIAAAFGASDTQVDALFGIEVNG